MACIYIFNGHKFNSELELDTFLLERYKDYQKYGDIVFSQTPELTSTIDKLKKFKKESAEHWEKYLKILNDKKYRSYNMEDGEIDASDGIYSGVNKFLSVETGEKGKQLTPTFIDENYWTQIYARWKRGEFDEVVQELKGWKAKDVPLTDDKVCDDLKAEIVERWEHLSKIGTSIHKALQIYFTLDLDTGKYTFDLNNPAAYILERLKNASHNGKKLYSDNDYNYVKNHINEIVDYGNKLRLDLYAKLGSKNLHFFPEFRAWANVNSDHAKTIIGEVDLVIIDNKGVAHILDYKTSIKDYALFDKTGKTLTYKYLMGTYNRMLGNRGIKTWSGELFVAPIRIDGFRKENGNFIYDKINGDRLAVSITELNMEPILSNISKFLPPKQSFHLDLGDIISLTKEDMKAFGLYVPDLDINEETTKAFLEKQGYLKKNALGNYTYKVGKNEFESADEVEFILKVTKFMKDKGSQRSRLAGKMMRLLSRAIDELSTDCLNEITSFDNDPDWQSLTWLQSTFKKYVNGQWELVETEQSLFLAEKFGIILLQNEQTGTIDVLRVSANYLNLNYRRYKKNRENNHARNAITGDFETDTQANSKAGSLMLASYNGNVELMETMFVLNNAKWESKGYKIGEMAVVNPYHNMKILPSSKELLYTFKELAKFHPPKWNRFEKSRNLDLPDIVFLSAVERAYATFKEIMNNYKNLGPKGNDFYTLLEGCTSLMDNIDTKHKEEQIAALNKLLKTIEEDEKTLKQYNEIYRTQDLLQQDNVRLRNIVVNAINELRGINFRQLLEDHGDWYQSLLIWKNGLQGNRIDNPGNLSSETLNLITSLVKQAYQNTRDRVLKFKSELDEYIKDVKEEADFGYVKENLGFNLVDLYKDLFVETPDGDLMFVHPDKISGAKRRLLEFALEKINQDRYGDLALQMKDNNDDAYYRVPLALGSKDSVASVQGWLGALKNRMKSFTPKNLQEQYLKKIQGLEYDDESDEKPEFVFKMTNMFDRGNESISGLEARLKLIKDNGIENMERNLETLLLKHIFAYEQKRNIDEVFPLMKGAAIHLQQQGANINKYFEKDLNYWRDYIWNKVLNKSLVSRDLRLALRALNFLKLGATRFALAFSPVQALYQSIQGFWQYVSLALRNPEYKKSFTFSNFRKAFIIVYKEIVDYSGDPTVCSRLNELYALNDMDMNSFIERIAKNKKGIYNLDLLAMKFSARPDYYNRMIILVSLMLADGSYYAHSINEKGELVYDWTKDKRFEKYANGDTSDPEYNKQRSLYYAMASLFVNEGTKNPDGSLFTFDMSKSPTALPRAYTTLEMNGLKSLADDIYGYYAHENKSLMMAGIVGSMWLLFKTYWSGKKNIYLQGGGIRLRGHWEHYTEKRTNADGSTSEVKWYYRVKEDGTIDYNEIIPDVKPNDTYNGFLADTPDKLIAPVIRWKGDWQEGVIVSVAEIFRDKNIVQNFKDAWMNEDDPELLKVFLNNIKQIGFDLFMFFVVGSILGAWMAENLKDLEDEKKDDEDLLTALHLSAARVSVMSVKNSFADLNFFKSIGSPITQWTPFAFDYWGRVAGRYFDAAMGEKNWFDTVVSNYAVGNLMKPLFNLLKPDSMKTVREGGTWESRSARLNRERREGKIL